MIDKESLIRDMKKELLGRIDQTTEISDDEIYEEIDTLIMKKK